LHRVHELKNQQWSREKLNYSDLERYLTDFNDSQPALYHNRFKLEEQKAEQDQLQAMLIK